MAAAAAAPPPPPALDALPSVITEVDKAHNEERAGLQEKIRTLIQDHVAKHKWRHFCKVHTPDNNNDTRAQDTPFLMTFLEAYEMGTIMAIDENDSEPSGKLFVGGLPRGTTEDKIWQYFGQWGRVEKVEGKKDDDGNPKGFVFVTFADPAVAQKVVDNKDQNMMDGKWIDIKFANDTSGDSNKGKDGNKGKGGKDDGKGKGKDENKGKGKDGGKGNDECKIFIGGLPRNANQASVQSFFSQYGSIDRLELKFDQQGEFRGFGFVYFSNVMSAKKLLENPAFEFEGKWVECRSAGDTNKGASDKNKGNKGDGKGFGKAEGGKDGKGGNPY